MTSTSIDASEHLGLAISAARSFVRRYPRLRRHEDDLVAEAVAAVVRAARHYDPSRGSFSTYATRSVLTAVGAYAWRSSGVIDLPRRRVRGEDGGAHPDAWRVWGATDLHPGLPSRGPRDVLAALVEAEGCDRAARAQDLERALGQLPPIEAEVIRRRFFQGESYRAVGSALDVVHETVRNVEGRALARLREMLDDKPEAKGVQS